MSKILLYINVYNRFMIIIVKKNQNNKTKNQNQSISKISSTHVSRMHSPPNTIIKRTPQLGVDKIMKPAHIFYTKNTLLCFQNNTTSL